ARCRDCTRCKRVFAMKFITCVCVAWLSIVATTSAHPVSTTTVAVVIEPGGRYVATITADADPLIAKLEALSADPLPAGRPTDASERAVCLDALKVALLTHVTLAFDDRPVTPAVAPASVSEGGQATIPLPGAAPPDARTVTWSSSLVFGSYPVAVRAPDGRDVVQWLNAQDRSDPVALAGSDQARAIWRGIWLGFTHILPNGIDHILFV